MKTIRTIVCLVACWFLLGCVTPTTPVIRDYAYVKNKAERVTTLILTGVLANNPKPELREKLYNVAWSLRVVTLKETVSANDIVLIADNIPQVNERYGIALAAGQLILEDELNALAIRNPELLRAAGDGIATAIEKALLENPVKPQP